MIIQNHDGTATVGPLDVICILKLPAGTFHAAFLEEKPFPGPVDSVQETRLVRLKSKMHHTRGAQTFAEAQQHLDKMRTGLILPDENVVRDTAIEVDDPVNVWTISNWKTNGKNLKDCIAERLRLAVIVQEHSSEPTPEVR